MTPETLEALRAAIAYHNQAAVECQTALDAHEFNAKQSEREKLIEQLKAETESQERIKNKNQAEIEVQERKLADLNTKVANIETKHGKSLRVDELDQKIAEREQALRLANDRWAQLIKKLESALAA